MMSKNYKLYILTFFFLLSFMLSSCLLSTPLSENFLLSSYVRGVSLAEGTISIKLKEKKYSIKVNAYSVGIFSIILDWSQNIKSFGTIIDNSFKSYRYRSSDVRGNKTGHMEIDFRNSPPQIISAQPDPTKDKRRVLNNSFLLDVNDPAAGIFNLALDQCKNTVKIYDGKRRYNIKVLKKESAILKNSLLSENSINVYKCNFEIERIAGYTKKELKKFPKRGKIWIKKHKKFSFFYPVKVQIKTKWGDFLCLIKERKV